MTVILSMALVSSNVIKQGTKIRLSEGMETNDDDNKIEDTKKNTDTATPTPTDDLNNVENKYKELLVLQDTILGNINALEDSLGSAEKIVKSMTKTVSPS
jgi:hypothetical protein